MARILKSTGIDITISANLKVVDFLDLTFNLTTGTYKTFNKPNNTPLYVHKQSSHPPNVTKNIAANVNYRLSSNCSSKELFEETSGPFQEALKSSGYNHKLEFTKIDQNPKVRKNKKRNTIYFNPPFSAGVKSKVGAQILKLVDSCFKYPHPLHKLFNRHTVKVSYRTTPNMKQIISAHNRKLLRKLVKTTSKPCTCTKKACPVEGNCQQKEIVYQAAVSHKSPETGQEIKET